MPSAEQLYHDPALVSFYDLENGWGPDTEFAIGAAQGARRILDLGCGTGSLTVELTGEDRQVTGVDPAPAMLDVARARDRDEAVRWLEGDARSLRLDEEFDLILLTGHAFQVFLTEAERAAVLATIAAHLAPGGRFFFDSRNPRFASWRHWTPEESEREVTHPELGRCLCWNDVRWDADLAIAEYQTFYRPVAGGETLSASAQIAFPPQEEIARLIAAAGLRVDHWYGDW
ncbi:class I SAM-dependent methyltransferase, partial [Thioclava sp. BHET1]